jgi:hypothetical protein
VDEEVWARVRGLAGRTLKTPGGHRFRVVGVDADGVRTRTYPWSSGDTLIRRRWIEEAAPSVAAGGPLPPRFKSQAARMAAILRAAGVGPEHGG